MVFTGCPGVKPIEAMSPSPLSTPKTPSTLPLLSYPILFYFCSRSTVSCGPRITGSNYGEMILQSRSTTLHKHTRRRGNLAFGWFLVFEVVVGEAYIHVERDSFLRVTLRASVCERGGIWHLKFLRSLEFGALREKKEKN
ncbi:Hypothetical predicted protein [Olea europaea subsp. europaea]|uniref:Uncharacterized protein n=1 Tax=Olea europaea subsp. europaea TaxID=158383 RepID=A0A8S0RSP2_OLEEU|nr:Hypothetical predicted protein [Olea europaea subsp. europaea]